MEVRFIMLFDQVFNHFPCSGTKNMLLIVLSVGLVLIAIQVNPCEAHGRLIEPPSRASAWRYGFDTPPNYNDHELYCGGFQRQQRFGGKCGECGDPWDAPSPRPHEYGGRWGLGVVTRKYGRGDDIKIRVELTASHMGYFEFRVCPQLAAKQDCLDKHLLTLLGGMPSAPQPSDLSTRFYPRNGSIIYEVKGKLPDDLECANCVLQWRYIAGNNWGMCDDGTGAVGCGPQEEFRACSDITIGDATPAPPLRKPGTKAPTRPWSTKPTSTVRPTDTSDVDSSTDDETGSRFLGPIIAVITLLAVVCVLVAIYLYSYHGQRIKHLMRRNNEHKNQQSETASNVTLAPASQMAVPPVPPPRTKRLSQSLPDIEANESSVLNGSEIN